MSKRRPRPPIVTAVRLLAEHDGDDRDGALSGTLMELLEARDLAENPRALQAMFDNSVDTLIERLRGRSG